MKNNLVTVHEWSHKPVCQLCREAATAHRLPWWSHCHRWSSSAPPSHFCVHMPGLVQMNQVKLWKCLEMRHIFITQTRWENGHIPDNDYLYIKMWISCYVLCCNWEWISLLGWPSLSSPLMNDHNTHPCFTYNTAGQSLVTLLTYWNIVRDIGVDPGHHILTINLTYLPKLPNSMCFQW